MTQLKPQIKTVDDWSRSGVKLPYGTGCNKGYSANSEERVNGHTK